MISPGNILAGRVLLHRAARLRSQISSPPLILELGLFFPTWKLHEKSHTDNYLCTWFCMDGLGESRSRCTCRDASSPLPVLWIIWIFFFLLFYLFCLFACFCFKPVLWSLSTFCFQNFITKLPVADVVFVWPYLLISTLAWKHTNA